MLEPERARGRNGKVGRNDRPDFTRRQPQINTGLFNARKFLAAKLDEILATTAMPGLCAVLVRDDGKMIVSAARGKRKIGTVGAGNAIQPDDKWILSSISKPITGTTIAAMIDQNVGGIDWKTTIDDVMPDVFDDQVPLAFNAYKSASIELMMAHSAGFGYNPEGEPENMWVEAETPAYLNDAKVRERRLLFTRAYVLDPPLYPPGQPAEYEGESKDRYGGGPIICAAMYERKTGVRFEEHVRQYVFDPLGMQHSHWGRVVPEGEVGPWQHDWVAETSRLEPDLDTQSEVADFHSHTPVGGFCMSAHDLGTFLAEFLVDEPKTTSKSARTYVLNNNPAAGQGYLSSGWAGGTTSVSHNGANGFNFADCHVQIDEGWAVGACSNASDFVSKAAVADAFSAMHRLRGDWEEIAVNDGKLATFPPCVHPTPGIVAGQSDLTWLVARRFDGSLRRNKVATATWQTWPDMIATSGVACAASADGKTIHVAVRGSNNGIWASRSRDSGVTWSDFAALPARSCRSGPALACSSDGTWLYAVALDSIGKIIFSASPDGGQYWTGWTKIGGHVFTAQPGIACSSDGQVIHVAGRAFSRKVMLNTSRARGSDWGDGWKDMSGYELFSAGPAVICDGAGDRVQLAGRNRSRKIVRLSVEDDGTTVKIWHQLATHKSMTSSPVFARKGNTVILAAYGTDYFPYRAIGDVEGNWGDWQKLGMTRYV